MNEITLNKLRWGYVRGFKHWLLHKLLFLMVLFGTMSLNAQTVMPSPWFEGFSTTSIPAGWTQNTSSSYSFGATPYNFFINAPASNIVAYKNVYLSSHDLSGLITPNIGPILQGDTLTFNYKASMYSTSFNEGDENGSVNVSSGNVDVLISTDLGVTYLPLATIQYGQVGWQTFVHSLGNYVGQTIKLKLVTNWDSLDTYIGFDNFYIGSCDLPSALNISKTNISATLTWNDYASNAYSIEYGPTGFTPGTGIVVNGVSNNHIITGLTQGTTYQVYVTNSCGTSLSPKVGPYTFTTESVVPSPWYEGFATTSTPVGWIQNTSSTFGFSATPWNFQPFSPGNICVYKELYYSANDLSGMSTINVGPILAGDQLSFNYASSMYYAPHGPASSENGSVNIMISNDFGVTYSELATIEFGAEGWQTFQQSLAPYVGQIVRIKFVANWLTGDFNVGFDNFYIGQCALPLTTNIAKTNNSATLSWDGYTGNSYSIEYGPTGFAPGTGTIVTGVSNNHLISGLLPTTTYQVYVLNNCGTSSSPKVGPFAFTTETVVPSPWFEGFATSTMPVGFNVSNMSLTNATDSNPGSNGYFYRDNIYTSGEMSILSTVNVGPILTGDVFSFDYSLTDYGNTSNGGSPGEVSFNVELSTDFGNTYISIGDFLNEEDPNWLRFEYPLGAYVGQIVKIRVTVTRLAGDNWLGIDNFYIGSCAMPNVPQVTNTTMNSAVLEWLASPTDVFEIEYGLVGFAQGSGTVVIATGSSVNITGLAESTQYEYYIRRKCSDTNFSPRLGKFKFITSCAVFTTGFVQNFDDTATGSSTNSTVPICWTFYDGGAGYGYVNTGSAAPATPSKHFYIYNNSDMTNSYILISPETDNLGNGGYQVRFKARGTSGAKLKFGRMSNKLDESTFVEIQEIALPTAYQATDFVVYLPVTTDDYFAFKFAPSATYQSMYVDNVNYEPIPACAPPVGLNAQPNFVNLTANLTWHGPSNATNNNFEIEWGEAGFVQGSADGTLVTSTVLNTTITNLEMGESYSFYVRRMCGSENTAWVGPYTFEMDYCSSVPTSNDGTGIGNVTIAGVSMDSVDDVTYEDFTDYDISITAGVLVPASITFNTGATYNTNIWVDLNNDGMFDNATELLYSGESLSGNPSLLDVSFIVPDGGDNVTGNYRMRIVTTDFLQNPPNSCFSGSWGVSVDLLVNITFPCIQPTNINFLDVGYEYVVLDWEGQGNTNFELEYGVAGFVPGTGTTLLNVTKPYTLENLTPGTTYDFYVRKKCGDLYSDWSAVASTYVFCDTPEPTGDNSQTLVSDELLSDLVINGQNLKFYADPGLTIELPASTALQSSGTFFVTQTINCESDSYFIVDVTVLQRIVMPIVAAGQTYCDGGVIGDIPVTSVSGATVIWYNSATSTTPLAPNTPLVTGTYYVVQTDGITTSHRLSVPVVVNTTPPNLVSQTISLCGNYNFGNLVINNLSGTTVKWYVSPTSVTPIPNNVPVETGTYYATQSNGACESQRVPYQITQNQSLNRPIAGVQNFCGAGTVADLVAEGVSGAQILWYASANSTNALTPATALSTGTYYVAQTMNGCTSERRAVAVRVISIAAPQISAFTVCGGGTISDLYIPVSAETSYKWYLTPSSDFELAQTTPLVQGTYFVERVQYGCVSARSAVQVYIGEVPNPPTGVATQSYVEGSTIADLILNQSNVVWYASFNDSQNGTNPLLPHIPLVNGATYYAVIIGSNGCPSYPFAVTVNVYLSNDEFDMEGLKYYPNPVNDVLNIDYVESIRFVEVFDLLGKRVKSLNTNDQNIQIDLSDLATGTYMIQLRTDSKTQFIKIIKK